MSSQGAYSKEKRVVRHKSVELPAHAYIALKILFLLFPHIYYENKNRR